LARSSQQKVSIEHYFICFTFLVSFEFGLVWFGLVWFGLVWFGLFCSHVSSFGLFSLTQLDSLAQGELGNTFYIITEGQVDFRSYAYLNLQGGDALLLASFADTRRIAQIHTVHLAVLSRRVHVLFVHATLHHPGALHPPRGPWWGGEGGPAAQAA
jgi:hypothetical protein